MTRQRSACRSARSPDGAPKTGARLPPPNGILHSRPVRTGRSPLAAAAEHKDGQPLITDAQFTAGERLAADYHRAHLGRRITSGLVRRGRIAAIAARSP
jgi:hypothetical protein